jgi:hypothetical protein
MKRNRIVVSIIHIKKPNMKTIPILLIALCAFVLGCEKESKNSNPSIKLQNPIEQLDWLAQMKADLPGEPCPYALAMAEYKGDTVFYSTPVGPACNSIFDIILLNREGVQVKHYQMGDEEAFENEVDFIAFL